MKPSYMKGGGETEKRARDPKEMVICSTTCLTEVPEKEWSRKNI